MAQSWHVLPVDGWYFPTTQSLHAADAPTEYCPLSQAVQLPALYTALKRPLSQPVHVLSDPRRVPGTHAGVGLAVGLAVGAGVGVCVGLCVGVTVGAALGAGVGWRLGAGVGDKVGAAVGFGVGVIVGTGACVGSAVGNAVGDSVGAAVGANVGQFVQEMHSVRPSCFSVHFPAGHGRHPTRGLSSAWCILMALAPQSCAFWLTPPNGSACPGPPRWDV
jgi:hypothetical protein